jgi:hypothetical protein
MERDRACPPLTAPALSAMMTYYLFRWYRIWGEHKAAGVKPPSSVQVFLTISSERLFHLLFLVQHE